MNYPSIRGEEIPYYNKKSTWNLLSDYIDEYSKILFDLFPGDIVQAISILQPQCVNLTFAEKSRYVIECLESGAQSMEVRNQLDQNICYGFGDFSEKKLY